MERLLIRGGAVYDGLGHPGEHTDVLIEGAKIARIGAVEGFAGAEIDARGLAVCPGFVDIHRHTDNLPFRDWDGAAELRQGITTTVAGNCGISATPVRPGESAYRAFAEAVLGPAFAGEPTDFPAYMEALGRRDLPLNMAAMIGTGAVRVFVKGFESAPFTPAQMERARAIMAEAMAAGAMGASIGIMYLPEIYGSTDEFASLLSPVGARGGILATHMRGEGDNLIPSVRELLEIAERAGCRLEISHFKCVGERNWHDKIYRAIDLIEAARAKGQDVAVDFYPYIGGSTALTTMLPPSFVAGDMEGALKRLGTPAGVNAYREALKPDYTDWDNFARTMGWERVIVSGVVREHNRRFLGLSVAEAAARFGFIDAAACAAHIMHDEDGRTAIITMSMCEEDMLAIARLPYASVISDTICAETDTPHPRMYGAFPKIVREFVREKGIFTLPEAIYRLSGLPASRMRLSGRGVLREGNCADVLVFDPETFADHATYDRSTLPATGLKYCFVNGQLAVRDDRLTGLKPGICIKKQEGLS